MINIEASEYNTVLFNQVFESADEFVESYKTSGLPVTISEDSAKTLFYLLTARYGNSPISNNDVSQFILKTFSIVFQYGPTWEKRLSIQNKLRGLNEAEIMKGATSIYNQAMNDGDEPSMQSSEELGYINQQNVNKTTRSKIDAYAALWSLLRTDVTEDFIRRFKDLFKKFVAPERPLLFTDGDCED